MPPRRRAPIPARSRGGDPTLAITNASTAKFNQLLEISKEEIAKKEENMPETKQENKSNDDLKKLIENLKNKMANSNTSTSSKKAPPSPRSKTPWNRSVQSKDKSWTPAYSIYSRISNHEKLPTSRIRPTDLSIKELPHSFLYRPGANGIKVDKVDVKSGKQVGMG